MERHFKCNKHHYTTDQCVKSLDLHSTLLLNTYLQCSYPIATHSLNNLRMDCRDSQNYDCRNNMYTIIPNLSFLIQKQTFLCKKSFDTVSDWIDYYNMTLKYTLFTAKLPRKMINVLQNLGCSLPNRQRNFLLYFDYFTYLHIYIFLAS